MSTVRVDSKYFLELQRKARDLDGLREEVKRRDDALAEVRSIIEERDALRTTLAGIANHLRTWATSSASYAEEWKGPDEAQAYTRTDVHRCRAATVAEAATFVETRIRALSVPATCGDCELARRASCTEVRGRSDAPPATCPLRAQETAREALHAVPTPRREVRAWVGSICGIASPVADDDGEWNGNEIGDEDDCVLCTEAGCVARVIDWQAEGDRVAAELFDRIAAERRVRCAAEQPAEAHAADDSAGDAGGEGSS